MEKINKKDILNDFKKVEKQFKKEFPDTQLSRDYYRNYGKFSDRQINKIFGTFKNLKAEVLQSKKLFKRDDIDIFVESKDIASKRYFVSSIVSGAEVDEDFMQSVMTYCNKMKAELILLVMRGVKSKDQFSEEIYEKYNQYFATEYVFNKNLKAIDFLLEPQMIIPLTGLKRYSSDRSIIIAHTKQFLETIPQPQGKYPHKAMTTGTISRPVYAKTRQGRLAHKDNLVGGLIVEKENNKIFHVRQIQSDDKGGFQDLDTYYCGNKIKKIQSESITIEPHYGIEDEISLKTTKEIIKKTNCKRVFFHDIIDSGSVNPHEKDNTLRKFNRNAKQRTLKSELDYLGEKLLEWNREFPKLELYVVPSNHPEFIDRWLESGDFNKDENNVEIGCELRRVQFQGKNPLEWYIRTNFPDIKNLFFLDYLDSFQIGGVEHNAHGNKGYNGSRGSKNSFELVYNKISVAHSHTALIYRGVYQTPCNAKLIQDYNRNNGGSTWSHGNILCHFNGNRQLINIINGNWCIK